MQKAIKDKGITARAIDPQAVKHALGAEDTGIEIDTKEGPISLFAFHQFLKEKLHSTGGRPKLEGAETVRRKVSFFEDDWAKIEKLAEYCREKRGLKVTNSQIAAALVHAGISGVASGKPAAGSHSKKQVKHNY